MIPIWGVVVLFTASSAARLVFRSVADCLVICVFTDYKFPWLGCCTCDFGLSHWMSWAMHSCSALGENRAGNTRPPIQKEAKMVSAQIITFLWWEMWVRLLSCRQIAWKRRVNQQEIHQLSINSHFNTTLSYWVSNMCFLFETLCTVCKLLTREAMCRMLFLLACFPLGLFFVAISYTAEHNVRHCERGMGDD